MLPFDISNIFLCTESFSLFSSQLDFMISNRLCISFILFSSIFCSIITDSKLAKISIKAWSLSKLSSTVFVHPLSVGARRGLWGAVVIVGAVVDCRTGGIFDKGGKLATFPGEEVCEDSGNATRLFRSLLVDVPDELCCKDSAHSGGSFHPGSWVDGNNFWLETTLLGDDEVEISSIFLCVCFTFRSWKASVFNPSVLYNAYPISTLTG